jgi:hypothetical protein
MENPNNPTGQLQWRRSGEGHLELYVSEPLSFEWRKYDRVPGFARDGAIGSKGFKAFCVWLEQGYKSLPLRDCDR